MEWLRADDYWVARIVFQRALALIYLIAFVAALRQFPALLGERGLLPVPEFVRRLRFMDAPSIFQWRYSDRLLSAISWTGITLAVLALKIGRAHV